MTTNHSARSTPSKGTKSQLVTDPYRTPGGEPPAGMSAAEIWCLMNGWYWPGGRPVADGEEKQVFRIFFRTLDNAVGLRLWKERLDRGVDPVTGGERR